MAKESGKQKICRALIMLLGRYSLEDISVKQLIAVAGVNRSTYNYHFNCMEDVFNSILDSFNNGLINYFESLSKEVETSKSLEFSVAQSCFQYIYDNRNVVMVIDHAGYGTNFIDALIKALESYFRRFEMTFTDDDGKEFTLSSGLTYELTIKEYCFTVAADLQLWMEYNFMLPIEEIINSALLIKRIHLKLVK